MSSFDAKFLDEIKNKNDIVDVIGKYVHLEQKGTNFWARCPFHHEKTASFCVNSTDQFYYCFGCHKSGDVIRFIMEIENLDFTDAIKLLADRVHIQMPTVKYDDEKVKEQKRKKERALDVLKDTATFYVKNLYTEKANKFVEYLEKRKIPLEYIKKYGIGASIDYNSLPKYLFEKGYTKEEMLSAGVVSEYDGKVIDFLANRLVIPQLNQFNQVVSFSGRVLEKVESQKYKNTRETIIFNKGSNLFNINNVKKLKNEKGLDSLIMVEGQFDAISMVMGGFPNTVASMGTALTKDQVRMCKRFCDKVYISYDGDFAGQKANIRGLEMLTEEGIEVKVVSLPEGMDPDDVIKNYGHDGYQKLLDEAKLLIDFKIDLLKKTFDVKTTDGKRKFVVEAIKVIRESSSPAEQEDLLKIVRDYTGVTFEALKRELYSEKIDELKKPQEVHEFTDNDGDKIHKASRFILASYLFNKPYAEEDIEKLNFPFSIHQEIKDYIVNKKHNNEPIRFNDLFEVVSEDSKDEISRIAGLETDETKTMQEAEYFNDCVDILKLNEITVEMDRLTLLYKTETDTEKRSQLAKEISKLLVEKNKITRK